MDQRPPLDLLCYVDVVVAGGWWLEAHKLPYGFEVQKNAELA